MRGGEPSPRDAGLDAWRRWFLDAAALVLSRVPDDGVAVFYQTDIKVERRWIDKGYLVQRAAEESGHALLWHKVVCRVDAGTATPGRPRLRPPAVLLARGVARRVARDGGRATRASGRRGFARPRARR